jgi:hypothetical protein
MIITEKIDGTNAAVLIFSDQYGKKFAVAQSRKRFITPDDDNYGFAKWVDDNEKALIETLGEGRHFGEWRGQGIQRKYGLKERRFSLFNVTRFADDPTLAAVPGLSVVPVLYQGPFSTSRAQIALLDLKETGSVAAPGFPNPEGIIVYHTAGNLLFKMTIENDDIPKSLAVAA